jgi:hypothetical protein
VGFVVDNMALGQVFSEYFGFPCQSFHQLLHHHPSSGAGTTGCGDRRAKWTRFHPKKHYAMKMFGGMDV